jgi:hypothetical protein
MSSDMTMSPEIETSADNVNRTSGLLTEKRRKHIDWDRKREEQLTILVIKHKGYKKTPSQTMEEKWGRISRELFSLDSFRDFQELDGYTLQKKFSRLKSKVQAKYSIYSKDFNLPSLPEYADELEKSLAGIIVETLSEEKFALMTSSSAHPGPLGATSSGLGKKNNSGMILIGGVRSAATGERGPTAESGESNNVSFSHNHDTDSEEEEVGGGGDLSSPTNRKRKRNSQDHPSYHHSTYHTLSSPAAYTLPSSSSSSSSSSAALRDSNNPAFLDLEFEKEKERKRMAHEERMEIMKTEYEVKEKLLKLENESKQHEAMIKLAEAHKKQAEVTEALLNELRILVSVNQQALHSSSSHKQ